MDRERSLRSVPKGEDHLDPEWSRTGARRRLAARRRCATRDFSVREVAHRSVVPPVNSVPQVENSRGLR